jgi:phage terminase large subunit
LKELQRLSYPRLYYREEAPDSITNKYQKRYGYLTTKLTRPQSLGMLRTIVREEPHKIKDLDVLMEMTTFVKNDKGKPEAIAGTHDDLVMARAINCYSCHQQRDYPIIPKPKPKKLPSAFQGSEQNAEDFFYNGVADSNYIRW